MLFRNLGQDPTDGLQWQDLGEGAPTVIGYANLCSKAITLPEIDRESLEENLSQEAKALLAASGARGVFDIRASKETFDSTERFLAVCVEYEPDCRLLFLQKNNPEQTVRFLDGFRQLCASGLIVHHLQKDFSLSAVGFEYSRTVKRNQFEDLIEFATKIDH